MSERSRGSEEPPTRSLCEWERPLTSDRDQENQEDTYVMIQTGLDKQTDTDCPLLLCVFSVMQWCGRGGRDDFGLSTPACLCQKSRFLRDKMSRGCVFVWTEGQDCPLWTVLSSVDCPLWTVHFGLSTLDCPPWTVHSGLSSVGSGSDLRPAGLRGGSGQV